MKNKEQEQNKIIIQLENENQQLKKELKFYKTIVDEINVSIHINDVTTIGDYKMVWANNYYKKEIDNLKERNNIEQYFKKHYKQEDLEEINNAIQNYKTTKDPLAVLYNYSKSDNDGKWIYTIGSQYLEPDLGKGEQMLCASIDLTDKIYNLEKYAAMQKELNQLKHELALTKLSKTEIEILKLLAAGKSEKDIATNKIRSLFTIKTHLQNIREKLNIKKNTQLVKFAIESGIA
jgi:DNA-binding CsgD family transcriptional regulator